MQVKNSNEFKTGNIWENIYTWSISEIRKCTHQWRQNTLSMVPVIHHCIWQSRRYFPKKNNSFYSAVGIIIYLNDFDSNFLIFISLKINQLGIKNLKNNTILLEYFANCPLYSFERLKLLLCYRHRFCIDTILDL